MARRPVPARRVRGALRVYDRSGIWWAQVPGAGRRSLGLRVADTTRTDAARAAVDLGVSAALSGPAAPVLPLRRRSVP